MRTGGILPALLIVCGLGVAPAMAQNATVVTHSGQRVRGQLVQLNEGSGVIVRYNGRDSRIPTGDVAMIDFTGNGNAPRNEIARASQNNDDAMVVLRNGQTISGRLLDLQPYSNRAVVAGNFGQRNLAMSQIARIYFNNGYRNDGYGYNPDSSSYDPYYQYGNNPEYGYGNNEIYNGNQYGYGTDRTITIPTNQQWTNTGMDVRRGQLVHFNASGNVELSQNGNDYGTPAGANSGRTAGNSPLPGVTGGMLIGRVNNGRPFVIGANNDVVMPANGRLFLGINDDYVGDNVGDFVVQMSPR